MKKTLSMLVLALFTATLSFGGYPNVTLKNYSTKTVNVNVKYAACGDDNFSVAPGKTGTAPSDRGLCLVTSVNASGAASYTSSGTSYSTFGVIYWNNKYEVHRVDGNGNPLDLGGTFNLPPVTIQNYSDKSFSGKISYIGETSGSCRPDNFTVAAKTRFTVSSNRGWCQVREISGSGLKSAIGANGLYSSFGITPFEDGSFAVQRYDNDKPVYADGYPKVSVKNNLSSKATVKVEYAGKTATSCRDDVFAVDPGKTVSPNLGRGLCLITKISVNEAALKVTPYTSAGTTFSMFAIFPTNDGASVYRRDQDGLPVDIANYPPVTIKNWTNQKISGRVDYVAPDLCKPVDFAVDSGGLWVASNRGLCLVKTIKADVKSGSTIKEALKYESGPGTSYSTFGVIKMDDGVYEVHRTDPAGLALDITKAYEKVRIKNNTKETISGKVSYGGETSFSCRPDEFKNLAPGASWTAPTNRGVCLVTDITAYNPKRKAKPASCTGCHETTVSEIDENLSYSSIGTSYSSFGIFPQSYYNILDYRVFRVDQKGLPATDGAGYGLVNIENKTTKWVSGRVNYVGCNPDFFSIAPFDSAGTKINNWIPFTNRGLCLLKRIEARVGAKYNDWDGANTNVKEQETVPNTNSIYGTLDPGDRIPDRAYMENQMTWMIDPDTSYSHCKGPIWADEYVSSGTGYSTFAIASNDGKRVGEEYKVWRTSDGSLVASPEDPGFVFKNKTQWPVEVSVSINYCLYHELIPPGGTYKTSSMGACWYTLEATIRPDGKAQLSTGACLLPFIVDVMMFAVDVMTAGGAVSAHLGMAATTQAAKSGAKAMAKEIALAAAQSFADMAADVAKENITDAVEQNILNRVADAETASLQGQYAGYAWPFQMQERPTYEITGGPKKEIIDGKEVVSFIDSKTKTLIPLVMTKVNPNVAKEMMLGSPTTSK